MRILVDTNIPLAEEAFGGLGEVRVFTGRMPARPDLQWAEALMVRSVTRVDDALLEGTAIRFVGTATIGTDHVDLPCLRGRGIGFASAPGCNAEAVKQYVACALLCLKGQGIWSPREEVLGVVGCGQVGSRVARAARALGLEVLAYDPPRQQAEGGDFHSLEELKARASILTLHVPLCRSGPHATWRMVDGPFLSGFSRLKAFINTSRGEAADEDALLLARRDGSLKALVLDVFAGEPRIRADLVQAAHIATPHIAGHSLHGKLEGTLAVYKALCAFLGREATWRPEVPVPQNPYIYFDPQWNCRDDLDFAAFCLRTVFPIEKDDAALKASLEQPDPGAAFDRLRRFYPPRFENRDFHIRGIPASRKKLRAILASLGFPAKI